MKIYVKDGEVVHVGAFIPEYPIEHRSVEDGGPVIRYDLAPINALPEGAEEVDEDIAWSVDGRVVLVTSADAFFVDSNMKNKIIILEQM